MMFVGIGILLLGLAVPIGMTIRDVWREMGWMMGVLCASTFLCIVIGGTVVLMWFPWVGD